MAAEKRGRGRPPAPKPKERVAIYLSAGDLERIDVLREQEGRSSYLARLIHRELFHGAAAHSFYLDSGQADVDEHAETDEGEIRQ